MKYPPFIRSRIEPLPNPHLRGDPESSSEGGHSSSLTSTTKPPMHYMQTLLPSEGISSQPYRQSDVDLELDAQSEQDGSSYSYHDLFGGRRYPPPHDSTGHQEISWPIFEPHEDHHDDHLGHDPMLLDFDEPHDSLEPKMLL